MASNTPIYSIAKELNIDSNRIISACKKIGINAKGSAKRLNKEELEKVKNYFETGKNVSDEIVEISKKEITKKSKISKIKKEIKTNYFPNRLIAKS
tara:strand:+ start:1353 stop:1640 length:288 start_codon:yes stop_codon:yes gene_type:complete